MLQHRFATCEDDVPAREGRYNCRNGIDGTGGYPFFFVKFFIPRLLIVQVWKAGSGPIPGIIGIAPDAMQVAQRGSDEYGGPAGTFPFSLDGIKYLGFAVEAGELQYLIPVGQNLLSGRWQVSNFETKIGNFYPNKAP